MKIIKSLGFFLLLSLFTLFVVVLLFTAPAENVKQDNKDTNNTQNNYKPTLTIIPQKASDSIIVSSAVLDKPGFIAAYKTMEKGIPDEKNFQGVSALLNGEQKDIKIPLKEKSNPGDIYSVIIHVDDGDSLFEFPGDDRPSAFSDGSVNYVKTIIQSTDPIRVKQ